MEKRAQNASEFMAMYHEITFNSYFQRVLFSLRFIFVELFTSTFDVIAAMALSLKAFLIKLNPFAMSLNHTIFSS